MLVRLVTGMMVALAGWAQWQAGAPRAGCVRGEDGRLRPLWGIAGNFVAGEPLAGGVISAVCLDGRAVVKLEREVLVLDERGVIEGRWKAPPGPALFAFPSDGWPVLIYFSEEGLLSRLRREGLEALRSFDENVAAIAWLGRDRALRAVRRAAGIELVEFVPDDPASDVLVQRLPSNGPVLGVGGGNLLIADGSRLWVRQAGGGLRDFSLTGAVTGLRLLGDGWIGVELAGRSQLLAARIAGDELLLFALPEVAP